MGTGGAGSLTSDGSARSEDSALLLTLPDLRLWCCCSASFTLPDSDSELLRDSSRCTTPTVTSLSPTVVSFPPIVCSFLPDIFMHDLHGSQNSLFLIWEDAKMYSTALPQP